MKKRFMGILLTLCMVLTLLPTTAFAAEAVTILSYPAKTEYTVGEGFDRTGIKATAIVGGEKKDISDEISFRNSGNVTLNQGTVFAYIAGKQEITLRWTAPGEKTSQIVGKYTVTSTGTYVPPAQAAPTPNDTTYKLYDAMDNGWYSIRLGPIGGGGGGLMYAGGNDTFINIDSAGKAFLRTGGRATKFYVEKKRVVDRDWAEITIKMADGRYLGIAGEIDNRAMYKVGTNPVYRSSPNGEIVGEMPAGTILEVTEIKGDWAKVKHEGRAYYMWAARLTKVNAGGTQVAAVGNPYLWQISFGNNVAMRPSENPKMMVRPAEKGYPDGAGVVLSEYIPNYADITFEDWSIPISNAEMAGLFWDAFSILGYHYPAEGPKELHESLRKEGGQAEEFRGSIVLCYAWGVFTDKNMNWSANPTYGEFTSYLIKLMDYNKSRNSPKFSAFTKDTIKSFAISGDTSANAKITWEQAAALQYKTIHWAAAEHLRLGEWSGLLDRVESHISAVPKNLTSSGRASGQTPAPAPTPTNIVTATPTNTKFMLNGAEAALPAYSIDGNNYVKLRDVGALLKTRFDVRWEDGKAKLYNHAAYTKTSGELAAIGKDSKSATLSTTDFVWGDTGAAVTGLTAYTIGGNNYIKLRDIAKLFDFDVDWRDGKAWIEPDVSPYTED